MAVSAVLWRQTGTFRSAGPGELGPDFWPKALLVLLVLCALVRVAQKVQIRRRQPGSSVAPAVAPTPASPETNGGDVDDTTDDAPSAAAEEDHETDPRRLAIAIALAIGYVLGAVYLGYLIATAVFVITFLALAGHRNKLVNAVVGVGAAVLFSFIFLKVVYISVPSGVGVFDLGTVWFYELIGIY